MGRCCFFPESRSDDSVQGGTGAGVRPLVLAQVPVENAVCFVDLTLPFSLRCAGDSGAEVRMPLRGSVAPSGKIFDLLAPFKGLTEVEQVTINKSPLQIKKS